MLLCRRIASVSGVTLFFCLAPCLALTAQQTETPPTIEVTTREVQVPVEALNHGSNYFDEVLDLTAKDFHVDVGGKEQHVSQIRLTKDPEYEVHDDYGYHGEGATSFGVWSTRGWRIRWYTAGHYYYIAFTPSGFDKSSCYKIHVSVDRPGIKLAYPDEYCGNTSPADPLGNTKVGLRLQAELTSGRKGYVTIDSSGGIFLSKTLSPTTQLTLEFPASAFHLQDHWDHASAPIALLGRLFTPDEKPLSQFSDVPDGSDYWIVGHYTVPHGPDDSVINDSYTGYRRQFDLPQGDYSLKLVLDNGGEFGRVEMPIHVPTFDPARLWISSVFLCRRFHQPTGDELEKLPPQYTPLISEGTEFEPAGDTRFTNQERLHLWFQIYAPPRSVSIISSIHYEIKLVNLQTGKVESDTGVGSVTNFTEPGKLIIPVWKEVLIGKLAPGTYRIDVQATDSVTGSTVQSSNTFTMVKKK
jgi:hypothetical protein